jgi:hypothetical protein
MAEDLLHWLKTNPAFQQAQVNNTEAIQVEKCEDCKCACIDQQQCFDWLVTVLDGNGCEKAVQMFKNKVENCKHCYLKLTFETELKKALQNQSLSKSVRPSCADQIRIKLGFKK